MKRAIIIFTRAPIAGRTKTRLMPHYTGKQCAMLHRCFLEDIRKECEGADAHIFVSYTPEGKRQMLNGILGEQSGYFPQWGESLGEKMYAALEYVLGQGYEKCLLIGTDVPEIKAEHLKRAFHILEKKEVVFGPAGDGGYYLVGMKKPRKEAFGLSGYGHGRVLTETLAYLRANGISVGFTQTLHDMDTPEDLRGYWRRAMEDSRLRERATARCLAKIRTISIIVPIYNEATTIRKMQEQLYVLKDKCEILFVDGGSTDRTWEMISPEFRVISSPKGRANQMNAGAMESTGDILFFLHCDSKLPKEALGEIRCVMRDHLAGCFGIAFHSWNFFMFTCRVISNHRVKDRKVMFGDQGIFVDRQLFFEVGMYPALPIMEDYQFSLTLKEKKIRLGMARRRIYTSHRRFPKGVLPKLKLMWKMNRLRKMYRDGVDVHTIAKMYRDVR